MSGAETEGGTMRQPEVNQVLEEAANVIVRVNDLVIELNSRIAAILNSPEEKIQKEPHPPEPVRYSTPLACSIDATIVDMGRKVISTLRDTLTRLEI